MRHRGQLPSPEVKSKLGPVRAMGAGRAGLTCSEGLVEAGRVLGDIGSGVLRRLQRHPPLVSLWKSGGASAAAIVESSRDSWGLTLRACCTGVGCCLVPNSQVGRNLLAQGGSHGGHDPLMHSPQWLAMVWLCGVVFVVGVGVVDEVLDEGFGECGFVVFGGEVEGGVGGYSVGVSVGGLPEEGSVG